MREHRHLTTLARIALLVTVGDLVTKAAATELLSHEATWFASWLHFAVIHNDQGAFGWTVGAYTWQLNLALTLSAIGFMIPVTRDLARVDPRAPTALGLIVGGALGNLVSLVTSPYGVVDFIQIDLERHGIALNVADVAAYAGLAMIVRTGALLVAALRHEARVREPRRVTAVHSVFAEKAALVAGLADGVHTGVSTGRGDGVVGRKRPRSSGTRRRRGQEVTVMDFDRVGRAASPPGDMPARDDHAGPGIAAHSAVEAQDVRVERDGSRPDVVGRIGPRLTADGPGGGRASSAGESISPPSRDR